MSIKMNIELEPFRTPNCVLVKRPPQDKQDGFSLETPKYNISELDYSTLDRLCSKFRAAIFLKAGVEDSK